MKDVHKGLRLAVHTVLNGFLSYDSANVPVSDEVDETGAVMYVILSTQSGTPTERNDSTWITRATILLDIVKKTSDTVSKDGLDDVANQIKLIMMPTPQTLGITAPAGFQYTNMEVGDNSLNLQLSSTSSITRKLLTFSLDIVQQ
jgi:hypothetical protein